MCKKENNNNSKILMMPSKSCVEGQLEQGFGSCLLDEELGTLRGEVSYPRHRSKLSSRSGIRTQVSYLSNF